MAEEVKRRVDGTFCRIPLESRFWPRVALGKPNECWQWTGTLNTKGYGRIKLGGGNRAETTAHRAAWMLIMGPVPAGMFVCHHCDNPQCVNPLHLFLGTHSDNMLDCAAKGRLRGNKRLTERQVLEIRRLHRAGGITQRELARRYGRCTSQIHNIVHGHQWRYLHGRCSDG